MKKILNILFFCFLSQSAFAGSWIPDTCDCMVDLNRDGTFNHWIHKCSAYASLDDVTAYKQVLIENQVKNLTWAYVVSNHANLAPIVQTPEGTPTANYIWTFDHISSPTRIIQPTVVGANATDNIDIQNYAKNLEAVSVGVGPSAVKR